MADLLRCLLKISCLSPGSCTTLQLRVYSTIDSEYVVHY